MPQFEQFCGENDYDDDEVEEEFDENFPLFPPVQNINKKSGRAQIFALMMDTYDRWRVEHLSDHKIDSPLIWAHTDWTLSCISSFSTRCCPKLQFANMRKISAPLKKIVQCIYDTATFVKDLIVFQMDFCIVLAERHILSYCYLTNEEDENGIDTNCNEQGIHFLQAKRMIFMIDQRASKHFNFWGDVYLYEPPEAVGHIPSHCPPEWPINASKTCLLPNMRYNPERDKIIGAADDCDDRLIALSYRVQSSDEIKLNLHWTGEMIRFFPDYVTKLLPHLFVQNEENEEEINDIIKRLSDILIDKQLTTWSGMFSERSHPMNIHQATDKGETYQIVEFDKKFPLSPQLQTINEQNRRNQIFALLKEYVHCISVHTVHGAMFDVEEEMEETDIYHIHPIFGHGVLYRNDSPMTWAQQESNKHFKECPLNRLKVTFPSHQGCASYIICIVLENAISADNIHTHTHSHSVRSAKYLCSS